MHWSGDRATLTLTHLNKEDEGLYTLRVTTKSGYETYSAYVFVRGGYICHKSYLVIKKITCVKMAAVHKISHVGDYGLCVMCCIVLTPHFTPQMCSGTVHSEVGLLRCHVFTISIENQPNSVF